MNTAIDSTLLSIYSDMYKDVHGFRPRGAFTFRNEAEVYAEMKILQDQIEDDIIREMELEEQAWELVRGRINACAVAKNCTWQKALRTLVDAEGYYDIDALFFDYGVKYTNTLKVLRLIDVEGSVLDF